jgi:hypothetical protein
MVSESEHTCVEALASAACHAIIELARGLLTTSSLAADQIDDFHVYAL